MKKTTVIIAAGFALLAIIFALFNVSPAPKPYVHVSDSTKTKSTVEDPKKWTYDTSKNQMGEAIILALVQSEKQVNLKFPYDGGTFGYLTVRKKGNKKTSITFGVDDGQIDVSIIDGVTIRVKFDDEEPQSYYMNPASDGSTSIVFFENDTKILNKLKKSKKVVIEAPFFQNGNQQFTFNTENLKW